MRQVLVVGCGYVGAELARRLVARGDTTVFGLRRRIDALPAGVTPLGCDLGDAQATAAALAALPEQLDGVVYAVGADAHTPAAYEQAYVRGLANLKAALDVRRVETRRVVLVSSTAVYAQDRGEWVDERSATEPTEFSGQTLLRSEALARSISMTSVVVRFGGIYGPGRNRFAESVRSGTIRLAAGLEFTNRVQRDDCAEILRHLLELPSPDPVYVGVDDEPSDRRAVALWMAERLGVDPTTLEANIDAASSVRGKRCSNARLRSSGYVFLYPSFREGYDLAMPKLDD